MHIIYLLGNHHFVAGGQWHQDVNGCVLRTFSWAEREVSRRLWSEIKMQVRSYDFTIN